MEEMYLTSNSTIPRSHHPTIPPSHDPNKKRSWLTSRCAMRRSASSKSWNASWQPATAPNLVAQKGAVVLYLFCWMYDCCHKIYNFNILCGGQKKQNPLLTLLQSTMCLGRVSPSPANFEISMIDAKLLLYPTARTPLDTARVAMLVISFGQSTNLWKQSCCKYFGPSLKLFAFLERMHTLPANIPARFPTNYLTSRNVWCL